MQQRRWRIVGINFNHMHMHGLLRHVHDHPRAEIVGVCDENPPSMAQAAAEFGLTAAQIFTDYRHCLEQTRPDLVILCPATGEHALWTERVAPFDVHVLVEKPFAANVADADRMIAALAATGKQLIINWPLRWFPPHVTAKRLVDEGRIGELIQVHHYGGNRGPVRDVDGTPTEPQRITPAQKNERWWYQRNHGGGSMNDYLGYGVTMATWFMNGRSPVEVTAMVDRPSGLEVDEHSITAVRYDIVNSGLSKFETRWGTFSDPWVHQPQPKCGFVLVGREGTISSYDYDRTIALQTRGNEAGEVVPVDVLKPPGHDPIAYVLDCLEKGAAVSGPLSPEVSRIGQRIVDAAARSAAEGRRILLR